MLLFPPNPVCLAPFPLLISAVADPSQQLSDYECLTLHAEVVALQQHLGITYKDASHWLYMAELEKLKAADLAHKAFKNLNNHLETYLKSLNMHFTDAGYMGKQSPHANAD